MFLDARQVEGGAVIHADLCIIGGGAAGITMAAEYAGSGIDVCLLESGGLDFDWTVQDSYKGENIGLPYFALDVCQLRYLGGNTNAWGGWCRPLDPSDFLERPWVEHSGWPFPMSALAPYYERAHRFCELAGTDYDPESWLRRLDHRRANILPFDPELLETTIYQFSPPTRFGQTYRERLRAAGNIRCYLNANVLQIRTNATANEVTRLDVAAQGGTRFTVSAKMFVMAAGGTEIPRLLLLSNDVQPNGLGNGADLVGRYFMEHPHMQRRIIPMNRRAPIALYSLSFHDSRIAARLALSWNVQQREELLNFSGNIHPVYKGHDSAGWLALRKLVLRLSASRRTDPFLRFPPYGKKEISAGDFYRIAREPGKAVLAAFLQLLQPGGFIEGYMLESKPEQAPNPDSRITLSHERDAFGQNRIRLDWRTLPIDRRTVLRAEEMIDRELQRLSIGRLEPLTGAEEGGWPANLEGGWHQLGTTRMHADPRHGVVDADCKVHGVRNLFIASGSVFPTSGAAPPTLTLVALTLRLAEHLKKVIGMPAAQSTMLKTVREVDARMVARMPSNLGSSLPT